jgi:hypothetical protein
MTASARPGPPPDLPIAPAPALGPVGYANTARSSAGNPFAGQPYSESTQSVIDSEVARLLREAEHTAIDFCSGVPNVFHLENVDVLEDLDERDPIVLGGHLAVGQRGWTVLAIEDRRQQRQQRRLVAVTRET